MATLDLLGLRKSFGSTEVLRPIDLSLQDGEMLVIVGASGCGKSTLLRLVAGLETPNAGRVILGGRDVTDLDPAERDIAMVFQNYALYPHMSVFDNMAYGLKIRGLTKAAILARVQETAALLGLSALLDRKPRQLSGGQRQRVAMGRAIVREPKLFLFDEPLSNLDAKLRVQMRADIKRLQKRLGVTSLYVTHDQVEAMTLGDRLLILHDGQPAQLDTPMAVFERPADMYVAGFIGAPSMNFLHGRLEDGGSAIRLQTGALIALPARYAGDAVVLGIRPEHLHAAPAGTVPYGGAAGGAAGGAPGGPDAGPGDSGDAPNALGTPSGALPVAVDLVEPLGSETLIYGRVIGGDDSIVVRLAGVAAVAGSILVSLRAEFAHVFDRATGRRLIPID